VSTTESTTSFATLGLDDDIVEVLTNQGITSPFPIQQMTIPEVLEGLDVCGKAKTGSGKTLAFGLPMVQMLADAQSKRPRAIILVPTRELCLQVATALEPFVQKRGHELIAVYGGVPLKPQMKALSGGAEVVVATPGRLIDLIDRKAVNTESVEMVIIDEADEMADMGFLPQVHHVMRDVRSEAQVMLFSATLDNRVQALVNSYLNDPVYHEVASETKTVEESEHRFLEVHHMDKAKVVARIAATSTRTIVFVQTKRNADRVAKELRELDVAAQAIHGDIPQAKRERTLDRISTGKTEVLVSTNVAARGIHIDGLDVVIHWDPPEDARTYLHRSGRTARAGQAGLVVTLVEWNQAHIVRRVQKEAGLNVQIVKMFSNDERLDNLFDWEPPTPEPEKKAKRTSSRRRSRNRLL
jgi:superfamily II DNA/RNA helicase